MPRQATLLPDHLEGDKALVSGPEATPATPGAPAAVGQPTGAQFVFDPIKGHELVVTWPGLDEEAAEVLVAGPLELVLNAEHSVAVGLGFRLACGPWGRLIYDVEADRASVPAPRVNSAVVLPPTRLHLAVVDVDRGARLAERTYLIPPGFAFAINDAILSVQLNRHQRPDAIRRVVAMLERDFAPEAYARARPTSRCVLEPEED